MKKLLSMILILALSLSLVALFSACGEDSSDNAVPENSASNSDNGNSSANSENTNTSETETNADANESGVKYKITVSGCVATVNGKEVTEAAEGETVIATPKEEDGLRFCNWYIKPQDATVGEDKKTLTFTMPAQGVKLAARRSETEWNLQRTPIIGEIIEREIYVPYVGGEVSENGLYYVPSLISLMWYVSSDNETFSPVYSDYYQDPDVTFEAGKYYRLGKLPDDSGFCNTYGLVDAVYKIDGVVCSVEEFAAAAEEAYDWCPDKLEYDKAIALLEKGKKEEAYEILCKIDYKDSVEKATELRLTIAKEKLKNARVGDVVVFGDRGARTSYPNSSNIEWQVLDIKDGKALLITTDALDGYDFVAISSGFSQWENCKWRENLNRKSWLSEHFSEEEQKLICTTTVVTESRNNVDAGPATQDKLFLLSVEEVEKYFPTKSERRCKPGKGVSTDRVDDDGCMEWFLRSPGTAVGGFVFVDMDGDIEEIGRSDGQPYVGIRPAMWVSLDS